MMHSGTDAGSFETKIHRSLFVGGEIDVEVLYKEKTTD